ncbi:hypothetical protein M3669_12790, partial [Staphylococcus capitis]|nr:hypothetical protein [Staphylococcus capitis]
LDARVASIRSGFRIELTIRSNALPSIGTGIADLAAQNVFCAPSPGGHSFYSDGRRDAEHHASRRTARETPTSLPACGIRSVPPFR